MLNDIFLLGTEDYVCPKVDSLLGEFFQKELEIKQTQASNLLKEKLEKKTITLEDLRNIYDLEQANFFEGLDNQHGFSEKSMTWDSIRKYAEYYIAFKRAGNPEQNKILSAPLIFHIINLLTGKRR